MNEPLRFGAPPSGRWHGTWTDAAGSQESMDLVLECRNESIEGSGIDVHGPFDVRGTYDSDSGRCLWTKSCPGRPAVEFAGASGDEKMRGTWSNRLGEQGSWRLWPVARSDPTADPLSVPWEGIYTEPDGTPQRMSLTLSFAHGRIEGRGLDPLGTFGLEGRYAPGAAECSWIKRYGFSPDVAYRGRREGAEVWGTWKIANGRCGGFSVWRVDPAQPLRHGDAGRAAWLLDKRLHQNDLDVLGALAGSRRGRVETGAPGRGACLCWCMAGAAARLWSEARERRPRATSVHVQALPRGALRIVPERTLERLRKFFGTQDLQVGRASFDRRFLIQGDPPSWANAVLDAEAQLAVEALADLGRRPDGVDTIRMEAGPSGMMVRVERDLVRYEEGLETFLARAEELFALLQQRGSEGIAALTASEVAAAGHCPVCGEGLEGPLERCPSCRTLHHADCWRYFGGCAIFGCAPRKVP